MNKFCNQNISIKYDIFIFGYWIGCLESRLFHQFNNILNLFV
ncbi:hypothetical protein NEISICOT_03580 [Neisseria sicca ATCC 29256]|uniref:Uncharacterized protein n=1 Tax=Neisseria sicca ATCC 29256 TaxID=547045 RepID=C6MAJ8_NEISI|nr:hypothetical protein NEISICOT_03580 [Neisseria sicca ATCC 29256]